MSATLVLRGVTEADRRIERQAQLAGETRAASDAICTALRNALRSNDEDEPMRLTGIDDSVGGVPRDRLRFFTVSRRPVRKGQPESDVREVEFAVLDPGEGNPPTLVRRLDPTRNDGEDGGGVVERIAIGVLSFDVSYHDGAGYRDEWPEELGWPTAVRFELVLMPAEPTGAPVLVTRTVAVAHGYAADTTEAGASPQMEDGAAGPPQQEGATR